MRKPLIAALITVALVVMGASACSSDSSSDSTTTAKDTSSVSSSGDGFSISTPEGEVTVSLNGELPSGWPDGYPLPKRTDTAGSGSLADTSSGVMVGVFTTKESGQDAYDFFTGESSLDPSSESSAGGSSNFLGSMTTGGSFPGSVTVGEIDGSTYIVVILTNDGKGSTTTTTSSGS
jgi:hypothetical protein